MTTRNYLKELERHLEVLSKEKRNNIITELKAVIEEENLDYNSVVERFGDVETLSQLYLEDIPIEKRIVKKVWYKRMRNYLYVFFVFILLFGIFLYIKIQDPFDYSLYNSNTIKKEIKYNWKSLDRFNTINIFQSRVIFYFTNDEKAQYHCKRDDDLLVENEIIKVVQNSCVLILPKESNKIIARQSSITSIKAKQNLDFDLEQSSLEISKNGIEYKYDIQKEESDTSNLVSKESPYLIKLKLYQSQVSYYKY